MIEGLKRTLEWFRPNLAHYCDEPRSGGDAPYDRTAAHPAD
jgi:hypothetical protein